MNRLTKLKFAYRDKNSQTYSYYQCICGTIKIIRDNVVKYGTTQSCECLFKDETTCTLTFIRDNISLSNGHIAQIRRGYGKVVRPGIFEWLFKMSKEERQLLKDKQVYKIKTEYWINYFPAGCIKEWKVCV